MGVIDFYLLKVETIKIGDSEPAPLFYVIVGPSEESKGIGDKEKTQLFSNISPSKEGWISTGIGLMGLGLNYTVTYDWAAAELYIDKGKDSDLVNKKRFDYLYSKKDIIENEIHDHVTWERLDGKRASRIRKKFDKVGLRDEEEWDELQVQMIDFMIKFEKAIKKYVPELKRIGNN